MHHLTLASSPRLLKIEDHEDARTHSFPPVPTVVNTRNRSLGISILGTWKEASRGGLSPGRKRAAAGRAAAGLVGQEVLEALVDECGVHRVGAAAGEVTPYARDDAQLGVGHALDLPRVVLRREVQVLLGGHHDRAGLDGATISG